MPKVTSKKTKRKPRKVSTIQTTFLSNKKVVWPYDMVWSDVIVTQKHVHYEDELDSPDQEQYVNEPEVIHDLNTLPLPRVINPYLAMMA